MATKQHELLGFLVLWADRYQRDYGLNGIHPDHHALMEKYGAPMERFPIATNARPTRDNTAHHGRK